jgi:hypothetical protein
VQRHPGIKPPGPTRRQFIYDNYFIAPGYKRISHMGADKAGTTGHKYPHAHRF